MSYTLTLVGAEDASEADRRAAEQRYRRALDDALGDASLVLPTYRAWLGIVARHGDSPDGGAAGWRTPGRWPFCPRGAFW
jgi:hypothetical protein